MKTTLIRKRYSNFPEADQLLDIDALKLFIDFLAGGILILEMIFLQRNVAAAINLVTHVISNFKLFARAQEALEEIKNLNKKETKELSALFAAALDLKNDKLEEQFEQFFNFLSEGYRLISQAIEDGTSIATFIAEIADTRNLKQLIPTVSYHLIEVGAIDNSEEEKEVFSIDFEWKENKDIPSILSNTVDTTTELILFGRDFVEYILSLRETEELPKAEQQTQLQETTAALD